MVKKGPGDAILREGKRKRISFRTQLNEISFTHEQAPMARVARLYHIGCLLSAMKTKLVSLSRKLDKERNRIMFCNSDL